jgi:transketolase
VGTRGKVIGIDQFGESAPYKDVFKATGFTVDNVINIAKSALAE